MRPFLIALALAYATPSLAQAVHPSDRYVSIGYDAVPVVLVPAGEASHMLLRSRGDFAGYEVVGGPPGLVWSADGHVVFATSALDVGQVWEPTVLVDGVEVGTFRVRVIDVDPSSDDAATVSPPPDVEEPVAPPRDPDRRGRAGMYLFGAGFGAWTGATVGFALGDRVSEGSDSSRLGGAFLGSHLGAGLGLGTAALIVGLNPDVRPTGDQVVLMSSTSAMGGFTAIQIARAAIPHSHSDGDRRIALAGTLGGIGGAGVGILWGRKAPPQEVMWNFDLGATIGGLAAGGALDMTDLRVDGDRSVRAPITLASAWAVGTTAGLLRAGGVPGPHPGLVATTLAEGAWLGAWAPLLVTSEPDTRQILGGLRLGLGAGYVLSQVLAPVGEVDGRSVGLQSVGFVAGNALGAGIPLALGAELGKSDADTRAVVAPMLAGSLAGMALGAAVAPKYDLSPNDAALLSVLGAWTTYQTVGWSVVAGHGYGNASVSAGHALTSAGAGTLLAMGFAPLVEITPSESLMAMSMGGWGTFYGAWIGHLARLRPEHHWAVTLGAGDVAMAVSLGVLAGPLDADWADLAFVDGFTFLGGAVGSLVGIVASPEVDPVAIGGLAGATAGLAAGVAFAAKSPAKDTSLSALGIPLPVVDLPLHASVSARPWLDEEGKPGVWVQLDVVER